MLLNGSLTQGGNSAGQFAASRISNGPAPLGLRGAWTFALTGSDATAGVGCGRMVIDASGNARLSGSLADGTPISLGTALSYAGTVLLYELLPQAGVLTGELQFADLPDSDAGGTLQWHRASGDTALTASASRYTPPPAGNRLLALANAAGNSRWTAPGLSDLVTLTDLSTAAALTPNPDRLTREHRARDRTAPRAVHCRRHGDAGAFHRHGAAEAKPGDRLRAAGFRVGHRHAGAKPGVFLSGTAGLSRATGRNDRLPRSPEPPFRRLPKVSRLVAQ